MLQKVCFLVNYNLYESKRYFTQKLAEAMNRKGIETRIIDVQEQALSGEIITSIKRYSPDITLSFNSLLPVSETKFLWDFLEIPHLAILVDPALYSIHLTRSPYSILSCVDRSDVEAVKSYQFESVFFLPHAVERELFNFEKRQKKYDVVFLGSCYDYESLRVSWRQRNPEALNKVLDDAIDLVFSDKKISLTKALITAWNHSKLNYEGVDFTTLFYYLDNYTRGKDRVDLIRSIKNAKVYIFGETSIDNAVGILGWKQYLSSQKNVVIHPSIPYGAAMEVLRQTKITLNSMPFFKNGSHERVFAGLGCGALPVTTYNNYFNEIFQHGKDILFYQMSNHATLNDEIEELLADENRRVQMVAKGSEKVEKHHTWDARVDQLLSELPPILQKILEKKQAQIK
jgi:spore maturation protein CgeB